MNTKQRHEKARQMHEQGASYADIATALNYKTPSGARSAVLAAQRKSSAPVVRSSNVIGQLITPYGTFAVKGTGTGSPLLDAFHGIGDGDEDFSATPDGLARAYAASVWAMRCIAIRAQALASIPLQVVQQDQKPLPGHAAARQFCRGILKLLRDTESDLMIFGRAYWEMGRKPRRLNPKTMTPVADVSGLQGFVQTIDGQRVAEWDARDHEIIYFAGYDPEDDFGGIAPLSYALNGVRIALSIDKFAEVFFKNGAVLSGILSTDQKLSETDLKRMRAEWERKQTGVENAHKDAILYGGLEYTPVSSPLKDLVMKELREDERRDMAIAFNVPMSIAQFADPALYAAKQDYVNFHTLTIIPQATYYADTITEQYLLPVYGEDIRLEPNTDDIEILQEDRTEISTRNQIGVSSGYMSLNEARQREGLDPLPMDYFLIGGKPIDRAALEAGDLSALQPPPQPASPFGFSFPMPPQQQEPRQLPAETPQPTRSIIEVLVRGQDNSAQIIDTSLKSSALTDLRRWQTKVAKKGVSTPFESDFIPSATTDFLKTALLAWDGETEREDWIRAAFEQAAHEIKAADPDAATPEEFEAYWRGIGDLFDGLASSIQDGWQNLPTHLANALRQSGQGGAEFDLQTFLDQFAEMQMLHLIGTANDPGALAATFLAGAARGNDLVEQARRTSAKGDPIVAVGWDVINQQAIDWARQYSSTLIRGINDTTLTIFQESIADWIAKGGTLEELADYLEGKLPELDIPEGWSPKKVEWATSHSRARLIAQTETTRAYHEGAWARWEQVGVKESRWRTNQDGLVCDICKGLNNVVGNRATGWKHKETGAIYKLPAHPGDRCFDAPLVH